MTVISSSNSNMALDPTSTLRDLLKSRGQRIVLAESCTAGRVTATLATLPGISEWLCGCFVVYRCDSKTEWLGIPQEMLDDPSIGPVSAPTTLLLARHALERTPEADIAVAVTGDIGPGVPPEKDGRVYCAMFARDGFASEACFQLQSPSPSSHDDIAARVKRLEEATGMVLEFAANVLRNQGFGS